MYITVYYNDKEKKVRGKKGETLHDILVRGGYKIDAPCGGKGTCNKCVVEVNGLLMQACQTAARDGMYVCLGNDSETEVLIDGITVNTRADGKGYGIAVDMGTTTVAAQLYNLSTGEKLGTYGAVNNQKGYGADVISRSEKYAQVHPLAINQLNEIIRHFGVDISKISIAGNTIMQHFTLGLNPQPITVAPFTPVTTALEVREGKDLAVNAKDVRVLPCVSGYVGADIIMGILATEIHLSEKPCILLDIGTNGEIVVGSKDGIYCCSTAAGPAFEGANISCGMSGVEGAISKVTYKDGNIGYDTIGHVPPKGICGSGLLDAVAEFLKSGIIEETGYMEDDVVFYEDVSITPKDIREVQLAKAAIAAGINVLLKKTGISLDDIDTLYLAGGFGNYLDKNSAATIGLIPTELLDRVVPVGNSSLAGCGMALINSNCEKEAVRIAQEARYIELSCDEDFQNEYVEQMMFPERK